MNRGTHIQKRTPKSKPGRTGDPQASYLLTNQYSSYHLRRTMNPNSFTPISTSNPTRGRACGEYPPASRAQACKEPSASVSNAPDPENTLIPFFSKSRPSRHSS